MQLSVLHPRNLPSEVTSIAQALSRRYPLVTNDSVLVIPNATTPRWDRDTDAGDSTVGKKGQGPPTGGAKKVMDEV